LGTRYLKTDSSGNATFTYTFPVAVAIGQIVTATATDALNNTSEFSAGYQLASGTVTGISRRLPTRAALTRSTKAIR